MNAHRDRWFPVVLCLWLSVAASADSLLSDLQKNSQDSAPSVMDRLTFSGQSDARFASGGSDITPFTFNPQAPGGDVTTFTAFELHLFCDVDLGNQSRLFVKVLGNSDSHLSLEAMALTTPLGHGLPFLTVGRFLNNFGKYPQRFLPSDNPLISDPLVYSYSNSLQTNEIPASPLDLIRARGTGLASQFAGYPSTNPGQTIISDQWFVNGLKVSDTIGKFNYSAAIVNDAPSSFSFLDVNDDKTVTVHLGYRPNLYLGLGVSYSQGAYLNNGIYVDPAYASIHLDNPQQRVVGVDVDYAKGHFTFFGEFMHSEWDVPTITEPLQCNGWYVEPRYKLLPGLSAVARYEQLHFNDIATPVGSMSWDYDVSRLDVGLSYRIQRDIISKLTYQWNTTYGVPTGDPNDNLLQAQLVGVF